MINISIEMHGKERFFPISFFALFFPKFSLLFFNFQFSSIPDVILNLNYIIFSILFKKVNSLKIPNILAKKRGKKKKKKLKNTRKLGWMLKDLENRLPMNALLLIQVLSSFCILWSMIIVVQGLIHLNTYSHLKYSS